MYKNNVEIELGDPVVVSCAPVEEKGWGPWQFPCIERLHDGRLFVQYHVKEDSAAAYGLSPGLAVSSDEGMTWEPVLGVKDNGTLLSNGQRISGKSLKSMHVDLLKLPEPVKIKKESYGLTYKYYNCFDLPSELNDGWLLERYIPETGMNKTEKAKVRILGETRIVADNYFTFPSFGFGRFRTDANGTIFAPTYYLVRIKDKKIPEFFYFTLLVSKDQGYTWDISSEIEFQPDKQADPMWEKRYGFTEADIGFMPDESIIVLLRTTDGNGIGPLYKARSTDKGISWDKPEVFDDFGVLPQLLTLKNGICLASYGRPGLYIRATADIAGKCWGDKVEIVKAGTMGKDTCSYSDMIALDDSTAMIVYSDFNYPDKNGQIRKTILVRKVAVKKIQA